MIIERKSFGGFDELIVPPELYHLGLTYSLPVNNIISVTLARSNKLSASLGRSLPLLSPYPNVSVSISVTSVGLLPCTGTEDNSVTTALCLRPQETFQPEKLGGNCDIVTVGTPVVSLASSWLRDRIQSCGPFFISQVPAVGTTSGVV